MLTNAVLVLAIVTSQKTTIDYEFYEDIHHCQAVAAEVNQHSEQRDKSFASEGVHCVCLEIENQQEEI